MVQALETQISKVALVGFRLRVHQPLSKILFLLDHILFLKLMSRAESRRKKVSFLACRELCKSHHCSRNGGGAAKQFIGFLCAPPASLPPSLPIVYSVPMGVAEQQQKGTSLI